MASSLLHAEDCQPLLVPSEIASSRLQEWNARTEFSQNMTWLARLEGHLVFVKKGSVEEAKNSILLNQHGVGSRLLGTSVSADGGLRLIYEYNDGGLYRPRFHPHSQREVANPDIPRGGRVTEQTLIQVNHAFKVLERLGLVMHDDPQFLIQADGTATLIDHDYSLGSPEKVHQFNERWRQMTLKGLKMTESERVKARRILANAAFMQEQRVRNYSGDSSPRERRLTLAPDARQRMHQFLQ